MTSYNGKYMKSFYKPAWQKFDVTADVKSFLAKLRFTRCAAEQSSVAKMTSQKAAINGLGCSAKIAAY
jgi:hypothetical protein